MKKVILLFAFGYFSLALTDVNAQKKSETVTDIEV